MIPLTVNQQLPEPPDFREDGSLDVHSIFRTIQGEGPFVGSPSIFIRLAGCNLDCPGCDTDYTSKRKRLTPRELLAAAGNLWKRGDMIVLTGGEPFRQNVSQFLELLGVQGILTQVETNGVVIPPKSKELIHCCKVVCSPKTESLGRLVWQRIDYVKYIIQDGWVDPNDGLPLMSLGREVKTAVAKPTYWFHNSCIYLQPMDEGDEVRNKKNIKAAVESCMKFGYKLSLQIHKILGME